jgi:carbamoyl-phosphate synthase large subunit
VDAAGTATAISVIKGLKYQKKYECKIITIDVNPFVAGRYLSDKFYTVPPAEHPHAVDILLKICKEEHVDLLVPIFDLWLPAISKAREVFQKLGTFPLISAPETIEVCIDKYKTFQFFKENNIPTVKTFTREFILRKIENNGKLSFPLFIKPRIGGRASINAFKVEDKSELLFYISRTKNWIVQEYIDGEEYTLDCLNTLDGKKCLAVVVRKRIETKGGLSVKSETVYDEELIKFAIKIGEKLKIVGPYNIQCFKDKDGNIFFTEINPRFAGTHAFSIIAGLNSILYVLDMLNGVEIEPIFNKIKYGLRMVRFWDEIIIEDGKVYLPWDLL